MRIRIDATTGEAFVEETEDAGRVDISVVRPERRIPLKNTLLPAKVRAQVAALLASVCEYADVSMEQLCSSRRHPAIVSARFVAWYVMHEHMHLSYPEIGRVFNKHHTSVMNGVARFRDMMAAKVECHDMLHEILARANPS